MRRGGFLRSWILGLVLLLGGGFWNAWAASDFDRGVEAYSAGRFVESAAHFERDLTNGRPTLGGLYNLGNARFRNGEIGRAIAAWRLAEHVAPSDGAIRHNLALARKQVAGGGVAEWTGWLRRFPPGPLAVVSAVSTWAWCVLLLVLRVRNRNPARLRTWAGWIGAFTVVLLTLYSLTMAAWRSAPNGVVVVRDSAVRFGPVEESPQAFVLPDGAEVRIEEERGNWLRIVDARGQAGWMPSEALVRIPE